MSGELEFIKTSLISRAMEKYNRIFPVKGKKIEECFSRERDLVLFWYNTEDKSTHIEVGTLEQEEGTA